MLLGDVVDRASEIIDIAEVEGILEQRLSETIFTEGERRYAFSKSDPARRLAARLAAKRGAARLLGDLPLLDVDVTRGPWGPPAIVLSPEGERRLTARGAGRTLVSLTHSRLQAAALVLLLEA